MTTAGAVALLAWLLATAYTVTALPLAVLLGRFLGRRTDRTKELAMPLLAALILTLLVVLLAPPAALVASRNHRRRRAAASIPPPCWLLPHPSSYTALLAHLDGGDHAR